MEELKEKITKTITLLEKMIHQNKDRKEIEIYRKKLDELLNEYLKDL